MNAFTLVKTTYANIEQVVKTYRGGIIEQKILELRTLDSKIMWDLGDLAMEILAACANSGVHITQFEAAAHVSWRLKGSHSERSPKTIEGYMSVCVFFPSQEQDRVYYKRTGRHLERVGARELYCALPFANFALAKRAGDRWESVLKFAARAADRNNGEPVAVRKIEEHFFPTGQNADATYDRHDIDDGYGDLPQDGASEINAALAMAETRPNDSIGALAAVYAGMKKIFADIVKKYPDARDEVERVSNAIENLLTKLG